MKITACYILHYGKEWFDWSLRSVEDQVDDIVVAYTSKPSHGHQTGMTCPETKEELHNIAVRHNAHWYDGRYDHEGFHRESAVRTCVSRGADIIVVVDADEIWEKSHLEKSIGYIRNNIQRGTVAHSYRVPFRHFWRSTRWVCNDPAQPTRFIVPGVLDDTEDYIPAKYGMVNHFGYAQSRGLIRYKMQIHGHKGEWRSDWWANKFNSWYWGIGDVHPTNKDFWNPVSYPVQENEELWHVISDHPYAHIDLIK